MNGKPADIRDSIPIGIVMIDRVPKWAAMVTVSMLATSMSCAQTTEGSTRNGMFLEGAGHAVYWSLNYESTHYLKSPWATHFRIGLGVYGGKHVDLFVAVPVTFSASIGGTSRGEFGLGVVPCALVDRSRYGGGTTGELLLPTIHAGYRYQRPDGNWFFRAGALLAHFRDDAFQVFDRKEGVNWGWNPYLSLGLLF